jgi:pyruvate ferredoxin oxidoreductase gamma subunit
MFQVRIHGRGGQGVVTAAELLSVAAFGEGRHSQAFPTFGSERTGAPVVAFCRIDDKAIRVREPITEPDAVIVQDPTLLHQVDLFSGVGANAYVLINTTRTLEELGLDDFAMRFERSGCSRCRQPTSPGRTWDGRCPTRRCSALSQGSPKS